jgi:SpoVK/Ycf46/Vps4 family AAA+-type ATPase
MAELKETLEKTVIAPVEQPERFAEYGLDPVSGVLLYGPPGCGKTYTAGALAGELGYYFLEVTPADLTSQYMGKPAQNVSDLFEIARANQPCVVFTDELDAMAGNRSDDMNTSEQQAVNQLLTALEDIEDEDIVVLGATNLVEDIDPAIRRSGRFDERIEIPPPDAEARQAILKVHLAERPTVEALAYEDAVEGTAGYAASDLERVADVTARKALDDGADIDTDHLLAAVEAVDSSIEDWTGEYRVGGRSVTQPDDVDLNAKSLVTPEPARTFADVGGMANLEDTLSRRVIEPLENPEAYAEYGIDVLTGLLLYGPPGCGKTYVTEALAGELGHYFLEVTPADLTSKWMGQPAQNVADLFEVARANQPCILFIDELDALAGSRSGGMNTSERQLVNQLLTELEQAADDDVVVVGATNLVDDIDAAIRRSGRFDERIEVPPPDADARRAILEVHLEDAPACEDIEWGTVTAETAGYAASDLELIAENAARRAFRDGDTVDTEDLVAAVSGTTSSLAGWDDQHRYEQSPETSSLTRSE